MITLIRTIRFSDEKEYSILNNETFTSLLEQERGNNINRSYDHQHEIAAIFYPSSFEV